MFSEPRKGKATNSTAVVAQRDAIQQEDRKSATTTVAKRRESRKHTLRDSVHPYDSSTKATRNVGRIDSSLDADKPVPLNPVLSRVKVGGQEEGPIPGPARSYKGIRSQDAKQGNGRGYGTGFVALPHNFTRPDVVASRGLALMLIAANREATQAQEAKLYATAEPQVLEPEDVRIGTKGGEKRKERLDAGPSTPNRVTVDNGKEKGRGQKRKRETGEEDDKGRTGELTQRRKKSN
ncbi:hypothetical protein BDN72DRAFT_859917 [Pluteus cervinus]|uniref:Uncharacterized protein n=1 Tax=Pluteus cervinus TaxID=181527 RepID=A0ACD3ALU1_9AGAR|nr:hypothetical protein BDN72DRAFT_859917 [Pluteus cervinus]